MTNDIAKEGFRTHVLKNDQILLRIAASMTALMAFDTFISLAQEVRLVWPRGLQNARWSSGKALYLLIRYGSLLISIAGLYGCLYVNPSVRMCVSLVIMSPFVEAYYFASCRILTQTYAAGACALRISIDVVQLLRTAALYSDYPNKKMLLLTFSTIQFIVLFVLSIELVRSYDLIQYPFSGVSCSSMTSPPRTLYLVFYALMVTADLSICAVCAIRIFELWTSGKSKLAMIILRDSLVYMIVLSVLSIPQFITPIVLPDNNAVIVAGFNYVLAATSGIACCRMILNIRSSCLSHQGIGLTTASMTFPETSLISQIEFDHSGNE